MGALVMRSLFAATALFALATPLVAQDAGVAVRPVGVAPDAVRVGEPFELRVERRWSRDLEPQPLRTGELAPLEVVERSVERSVDGDAVVEVRRLRAYLFEPGAVAIGAVTLVAHDPATGAVARARSEPVALTASNPLPADDDGAIEVALAYAGPAPRVRHPLFVLALVALAVGVPAAWVAWRRRRRAAVAAAAANESPRVDAPDDDPRALRARLDALERAGAVELDAERDAHWHTELWRVVRGLAGLRLRRSLRANTVSESAARVRSGVDTATGDGVAAVGGDCDGVRFAARTSARAERAARIERARRLARALGTEEAAR